MPRRMRARALIPVLLSLLPLSAFRAVASAGVAEGVAPNASPEGRLAATLPSLGLAAGAGVRSIDLHGGNLTVDFTPETARGLSDGSLEALADAVRAAYRDVDGIEAFSLMAGGRSLAAWLPPVPEVAPMAGSRPRRTPERGALSGKVIVLSPGHGWTYWGTSANKALNPYWHLQRSYYSGIVEDFLNPEMIQYVYNLLVNNGATVYTTREMDKSAGDCTTAYTFANLSRPAPNEPWWQMGALYYAARVGAPSGVYENGRLNDYDRDIIARPQLANWRKADLMISLHNNGGGGTGTETLYDTANGYTQTDTANQYGSRYLAEKIQSKVVNLVRANYYSGWYNRTAKGFAGDYGENREARCPAVLIETAFMDKVSPDNNALHNENFKMLVGKAIYEGVCDYFHVAPTYKTTVIGAAGAWTAQPWNRTDEVKLGAPVNAPPSSTGGWVYAATDAGALFGIETRAATGAAASVRWRYPASGALGAAVKARPTVYNDTVYVVAASGVFAAVDRLTGSPRWTAQVPSNGALTASPAATAGGIVVVGSDNGYLYAYRQDTGELANVSPAPFGPIRAEVAIPDSGHVWVSSEDGRVRCVSGDLMTVLWETGTGAPVRSSPFVLTSNNAVYFTNEARTVLALNASNGSPAQGWTSDGAHFGTDIRTSPWADAASGFVAFGMANHSIAATVLDAPLMPAAFPLRPAGVKEFTGDPVVVNGTVLIAGTDGRVYALKPVEGDVSPGADWRVFDVSREFLPGPFNAAPCVTGAGPNDVVAVGSANGSLYLLPLD